MSRVLWLTLFAFAFLATSGDSLRANAPPPWLEPDSKKPELPAPPLPVEAQEVQPDPLFPAKPAPDVTPRPTPRRTRLFRSCGSGMGAGLAGIGVGWAMLWLGTRIVNRTSRV